MSPADPIKVVTYNLRYATADDGHPWSERREPMIELITELAPDVLGTQEGLGFALADLAAGLPGRYGWVGRGREVGYGDGEHAAVFYDITRFDVVAASTRWLSDTPDVPGSMTWQATLPRIVTHVTLVERASGRELDVVNTHLDYEFTDDQLRSVDQIGALVSPLAAAGRTVVVTGDFNAVAGTSEPYRRFAAESGLHDAVAGAAEPGPQLTSAHAYEEPEPDGPRIDWIFSSPDLTSLTSRVVGAKPHGVWPSDHLPVEAVLQAPS